MKAVVDTNVIARARLLRSIDSGVTVYDALFVELATRTAYPHVTFDKTVLRAFPQISCHPRELPYR